MTPSPTSPAAASKDEGGALRAVLRQPGLVGAHYLWQLAAAAALALPLVLALAPLWGLRPAPETLDWAVLYQLEPRLLFRIVAPTVVVLAVYALLVPWLTAGTLERLQGGSFRRGLRHGPRLLLLQAGALALGITSTIIAALATRWLHRRALAADHEGWQLVALLLPLALWLLAMVALATVHLHARACVARGDACLPALQAALVQCRRQPARALACWLLPALLRLVLAVSMLGLWVFGPAARSTPSATLLVTLQLLLLVRAALALVAAAAALEHGRGAERPLEGDRVEVDELGEGRTAGHELVDGHRAEAIDAEGLDGERRGGGADDHRTP